MKLSAQSMHDSLGFTLIELMVVVGLMAILSGAMIPNFSTYISNQNRKQAQEQVKSDLRTIQNRALTGVGYTSTSTHWGVYLGVGNSVYSYLKITGSGAGNIVAGADCVAGTENSTPLPSNQVVRASNTTAFCVFFSFANGDATLVTIPTSGARTVTTTCATSTCTINVSTPTGTTCGPVGVNKSGLILNNADGACP